MEKTFAGFMNSAGVRKKEVMVVRTWGDFLLAVKGMRDAQRLYKKTRSGSAKESVVLLEKAVDEAVIFIQDRQLQGGKQCELFEAQTQTMKGQNE